MLNDAKFAIYAYRVSCGILSSLSDGEELCVHEVDCGKSMFRAFLGFCKDNGIVDGYNEDIADSLFDGLLAENNGNNESEE